MSVLSYSRLSADSKGNDPLFLLFHGGGDNEREMSRFFEDQSDADYISFVAPHHRVYIPGSLWWKPDATFESRKQECLETGEHIVSLLRSLSLSSRPLTAIGFSQGAYLVYRLLTDFPSLLHRAVLLSPPFPDTEPESKAVRAAESTGKTPTLLIYGDNDLIIDIHEQHNAATVLNHFTALTEHTLPSTGHDLTVQEATVIQEYLAATH